MYVRVHVVPNSKKERVTRVTETEFHIVVREPALQNRANRRILELIAEAYGVSVKQVRLLTGHRSSAKIVSIEV